MALQVEKFENAIQEFNQKYQVKFDLKGYASKAKALGRIIGKDAYNDAYKVILSGLYYQALEKIAEGETLGGSLTDLGLDFEKKVMAPFVEACKAEKMKRPKAYGGMSEQERVEHLQYCITNAPKNLAAIAGKKYLEGDIRIRDMVAYTKGVLEGKPAAELTEKEMKKVASYVLALERVQRSRSIVWKIFHPFRNNAEQRDAKWMREAIQGNTGNEKAFESATKEVERFDVERNLAQVQEKVATVNAQAIEDKEKVVIPYDEEEVPKSEFVEEQKDQTIEKVKEN